jgi:hypothetical protein
MLSLSMRVIGSAVNRKQNRGQRGTPRATLITSGKNAARFLIIQRAHVRCIFLLLLRQQQRVSNNVTR